MEKGNLKGKLTKRKVLFIVNIVFFVLVCLTCIISICAIDAGDIFEILIIVLSYISSQFTFTALSLIVYYLAIMAGALNKKYKEEVKDNAETRN